MTTEVAWEAARILDEAAGVPGCVVVAETWEEPTEVAVARVQSGDCGDAAACILGAERSAHPLVTVDMSRGDAALILAHEVTHWITRRGNDQHDDWGIFAATTATVSTEATPATREALERACEGML